MMRTILAFVLATLSTSLALTQSASYPDRPMQVWVTGTLLPIATEKREGLLQSLAALVPVRLWCVNRGLRKVLAL